MAGAKRATVCSAEVEDEGKLGVSSRESIKDRELKRRIYESELSNIEGRRYLKLGRSEAEILQ